MIKIWVIIINMYMSFLDEQVLDAISGVNVSLRIGVMQNIGDKTEQGFYLKKKKFK